MAFHCFGSLFVACALGGFRLFQALPQELRVVFHSLVLYYKHVLCIVCGCFQALPEGALGCCCLCFICFLQQELWVAFHCLRSLSFACALGGVRLGKVR